MVMDFFDHQDKARRKTGLMVWMFIAAVLAIITLTYLVVSAFVVGAGLYRDMKNPGDTHPVPFSMSMLWDPKLLLIVGAGVLAVVVLGSLYKLAQLKGGGKAIAETLGGRLLSQASTDLTERKILNVVQEMAIASGIPAPPVYMMDTEKGINAFAAGFSPTDAVIGVTRGCVEELTRDELQGVIAHEFSHILNGDMRLNIRLMGVIFGILVIGLVGSMILRVALISGSSRRSNSKSNPLPLLALGGALLVIGYTGVFFANMIKASVSRQREFLADASAVQFTRNPDGIAGALKRIAVMSRGFQSSESYMSHLDSPNAQEVSHMFFGEGISHWFGASMSTHPPLAVRIKRVDPSFDGNMAKLKLKPAKKTKSESASSKSRSKLPDMAGVAIVGAMAAAGMSPLPPIELEPASQDSLSQMGKISSHHLDYAAQLIEKMPKPIITATHDAYGARALVYALLLDDDKQVRGKQIKQLEQHADKQVYRDTLRLEPMVLILDQAAPLALIDLVIAPLREMAASQYQGFKKNVTALINADHKVSLFEWTLHRILMHHLEPAFSGQHPDVKPVYGQLQPVASQIRIVLSTLAYIGNSDKTEIQKAFESALPELGSNLPEMGLLPTDQCSLKAVGQALDELVKLKPSPKRQVVRALAKAISSDGQVTVREAELFRAVVDSLDCPVPPLLPGQPLV